MPDRPAPKKRASPPTITCHTLQNAVSAGMLAAGKRRKRKRGGAHPTTQPTLSKLNDQTAGHTRGKRAARPQATKRKTEKGNTIHARNRNEAKIGGEVGATTRRHRARRPRPSSKQREKRNARVGSRIFRRWGGGAGVGEARAIPVGRLE